MGFRDWLQEPGAWGQAQFPSLTWQYSLGETYATSNLRVTILTHRCTFTAAGHTAILWRLAPSNTSLENNPLLAIPVIEGWVAPNLLITIIDVNDTFIFSLTVHLLRDWYVTGDASFQFCARLYPETLVISSNTCTRLTNSRQGHCSCAPVSWLPTLRWFNFR